MNGENEQGSGTESQVYTGDKDERVAMDGSKTPALAQKTKGNEAPGERKPDLSPPTRRGLPKISVSTSEPVVDASGDFSIFVVIENPFDVSITVYSVQTHIPVELIDTVWLQKYRTAVLA